MINDDSNDDDDDDDDDNEFYWRGRGALLVDWPQTVAGAGNGVACDGEDAGGDT